MSSSQRLELTQGIAAARHRFTDYFIAFNPAYNVIQEVPIRNFSRLFTQVLELSLKKIRVGQEKIK